ncbi:GNAT family N-acetyltransferase [Sphingomonas sanguinis]|uniref:GNAT family N-acetyltransferase n=1 Tax=Sphingomonas sanguinis TaxID=33051 RepID=UPI001C58D080|nr:GNAT family N-acetyltransferase [Sphingomonas sanguinis]QXT35359.1 GNAT family N-acetyltransferase [Sphingomonas sanguinis]
MFARTPRLLLRPAWPEDAAALTKAIGHEAVARMAARVPHPYTHDDAERWLAQPCGPTEPRFLMTALDRGGAPELIGGIAIIAGDTGHELGYWLTPDAWGRGYATEAGRAVVAMARHALPITRLNAWHFVDNPASGHVLTKLGFRPTGQRMARASAGRATLSPSIHYALDLEEERNPAMPLAA